MNTIIGSSAVLGLAVGSLLAGKVMGSGRRNCILTFNCFLFIGVLFTMVQSMFTLCLGRFMHGVAAGVLNLCMSVSMSESVTVAISG